MDISDTIKANSEQVNADDLMGGPVTVRVTSVERGSAEQPVFIHTDVFEGRTYRPSKSMRRVLVSAWGAESANYVGRSMTIFRNPDISFGREKVGGIQISAMSDIPRALTIPLTVSRGKRAPFVVQPLEPQHDVSGRDWLVELTDADGDVDAIGALGQAAKAAHASPTVLNVIRKAFQDAKEAGSAQA